MSKIVFNANPSVVYDGDFAQIGINQVRVVFDTQIPSNAELLSGFNLINEHNGFIQTKREDYKYIYRTYENPLVIELCNDGIEYVEPEPIVIPEPEPYVPTYEEVLENKINELETTCNSIIISGLDVNGNHYSYDSENQKELEKVFNTVKVTGLPIGFYADDKICREYSAQEIINIYIALTMNEYSQKTYLHQTCLYLKSLEHTDENKAFVESYEYGTDLIGEYLSSYNKMISLYNSQIQAMLPTSK